MNLSPTVLLVEDEQHIIDFVLVYLERHFRVEVVMDGDEALRRFPSIRPAIVVLDLGLPGLDGLELFKELRRRQPDLPVVILTARVDEADRVCGLELGADDYVTKPFSGRELAARLKNILRRATPPLPTRNRVLTVGPLQLVAADFSARLHGTRIGLTRVEYNFIQLLMEHPDQVFTRDHLLNRIYEEEYHAVTRRSIDAYVRRLRRKFENTGGGESPIKTVHGLGYKLNPELIGAVS